ncbi:MAG: mycothione reductase [Propionibacteriaceae bacterium]|jgi:mycothione reductase|nr:mycothione reductase [Propionibacteriaceae bacterium]
MEHFDLCVIGSGTGNSLIGPEFSHWRVALVEGGTFGGTCLNRGCIPTKMLWAAAHAADVRGAAKLGVHASAEVFWPEVRDRVFSRIDPISASGEQWRESNPNVTLYRTWGAFTAPGVLAVGDEQITADRFVIAAGSRPHIPQVFPEDPRIHTSDTIMRIPELPKRLVIVGGGAIAAEFAYIFAAFGVEVTLLHRGPRLLRTADEQVAERFTQLLGGRVNLRLRQEVISVDVSGEVVWLLTRDPDGIEYSFEGDLVLVATGRVPSDVGAPAAGIVTSDGRIIVDEYQRANVPGVWALGDVSSPVQLKHLANAEARTVRHNLLHEDLIATDKRYVPRAVFSGPEVAWVGATEQELRGQPYAATVREYSSVAYGWALEDTDHFVKLLTDKGILLGAHIVGPQAATLLQPLIGAMGRNAHDVARGQYWIHPALAEVVENALLDTP